MRRFISSVLALALVVAGTCLMILWDHHSLAVIWTDPLSIFWNDEPHRSNLFWFMGPMLIFAGVAVIAEDWFGLANRACCSKDSASPDGKKLSGPAYDRDPQEPPTSSILRSLRRRRV